VTSGQSETTRQGRPVSPCAQERFRGLLLPARAPGALCAQRAARDASFLHGPRHRVGLRNSVMGNPAKPTIVPILRGCRGGDTGSAGRWSMGAPTHHGCLATRQAPPASRAWLAFGVLAASRMVRASTVVPKPRTGVMLPTPGWSLRDHLLASPTALWFTAFFASGDLSSHSWPPKLGSHQRYFSSWLSIHIGWLGADVQTGVKTCPVLKGFHRHCDVIDGDRLSNRKRPGLDF